MVERIASDEYCRQVEANNQRPCGLHIRPHSTITSFWIGRRQRQAGTDDGLAQAHANFRFLEKTAFCNYAEDGIFRESMQTLCKVIGLEP